MESNLLSKSTSLEAYNKSLAGISCWLNRTYRWLYKSDVKISLDGLPRLVKTPYSISRQVIYNEATNDPRFKIKNNTWQAHSLEDWRFNGSILETEFVVFDLESTGSVLGKDEIFEIGAVKMYGSNIVDRFHSYVYISREIPSYVLDITKIDSKKLVRAPYIGTVLRAFFNFCGSSVLVAHNSEFDFNFLFYEAQRCNLVANPALDLCTWLLAQKLLPKLAKYGLSDLPFLSDHDLATRHSALTDAKIAGDLLGILIKIYLSQNNKHCLSGFLAEEKAIFKLRYNPIKKLNKK